MARYFFVSLFVAAIYYVLLRSTIGTVVWTEVDESLAKDGSFFFPALIGGVVACWVTRPAVRAQSFVGPVFASALFPFVAGCVLAACTMIFGRSPEEVQDFVGSVESTFYTVLDAPLYVAKTLAVSMPAAFIGVIALRASDPAEQMREKRKRAAVG